MPQVSLQSLGVQGVGVLDTLSVQTLPFLLSLEGTLSVSHQALENGSVYSEPTPC